MGLYWGSWGLNTNYTWGCPHTGIIPSPVHTKHQLSMIPMECGKSRQKKHDFVERGCFSYFPGDGIVIVHYHCFSGSQGSINCSLVNLVEPTNG